MRNIGLAFLLPLLAWNLLALGGDENPPMPQDAVWTIYCQSFVGPLRVTEVKQKRAAMIKSTGWKDWHVAHLDQESVLYYGFYHNIFKDADNSKDRREAEGAYAQLKALKELKDADNNRVFQACFFTQIAHPEQEGPPEWNLLNTPKEAYWSVLIGVYRDNPDYKKAALEAVKKLRDSGEEAYYVHGATSSTVCVGTWPRAAIKEQESDTAKADDDPNVEIRVSPTPLPADIAREYTTPEGKKIRWVCPVIVIQDSSLQAVIDRYPYFYTNGQVMGKKTTNPITKKVSMTPDHSSLLIIPHRAASSLDNAPSVVPPEVLQQLAKPATATPGKKLKKLDE